MKILQINGGVFGSTGKIMFGIAKEAKKRGHKVLCASPVTFSNRFSEPDEEYIKIGGFYGRCASVLLARISGFEGHFAYSATKKLIRKIEDFSPDIIHLHSIHNSYINLPLLFGYIKRKNIKTVWTLHDCWAFTGHCPHFESAGCEKWKSGCGGCSLFRNYPKSFFDNSAKMFEIKRELFTGIENLTIVTPSEWLGNLAGESFLGGYPVKIINNGIDPDVFCPIESDFREKHGLFGKKIVLGCAFGWNEKKGLDVFIKLAGRLGEGYKIVLVGTDEKTEKSLPEGIIPIRRTENQRELAEIYSAADIFVNPTREDTFPTVNLEAASCGTPVITYDSGGCAETIGKKSGMVIRKDDFEALVSAIKNTDFAAEDCRRFGEKFDMRKKFGEYISLYEEVFSGSDEN